MKNAHLRDSLNVVVKDICRGLGLSTDVKEDLEMGNKDKKLMLGYIWIIQELQKPRSETRESGWT